MKENRWSTTQFDRPPMTKPRTPEEIAEEWFKIHDGMCVRSIDGQPYREHFLAALREAADTAVAPYVQMMQRIAHEALRPAAPEAKESDCTCGEQWPCPLHGGPPAAPEPTPSEKCPYCGLTTCRYGADPTST